MINGNDLRLALATSRADTRENVLHELSFTLDYGDSLLEVTTSDTGSYSEFITNRRVYGISCEALLDYSSAGINAVRLFDKAIAGSEVFFEVRNGNERLFSGSGFITNIGQTGNSDEVASVSFDIQPTGPILRSIETNAVVLCNLNRTLCNNDVTLCGLERSN